MKDKYDSGVAERIFLPGEKVRIRLANLNILPGSKLKSKWSKVREVVRVKGPVVHVLAPRTGTIQPIHADRIIKSNLESDPTQADSDPDPDYDPKSDLNTTAAGLEVSKSLEHPPPQPPPFDVPQASSSGEVSESKIKRDLIRRNTRFKKDNKCSDYVYYSDNDSS